MGSNRRVRSTHRMLSFVLSLIMVISLIPVSVLADDEIKNPTETIEQSFIAGIVSLPKAEVIPEQEPDVAVEEEPDPVIVQEQVPETEPEEETQPEIIPEEIPEQVKEPEQVPEAAPEAEPETEPEVEKEPELLEEPEQEKELVPETEQEIIPEEETEQTPSPKKTIKIYTQAEIEGELKKETAPEKVAEAKPEKEPEQVVEPEQETEPEAEAELEKETKAEVEAEVEPEKDPEVIEEPEQETDVETEPEKETEAEAEPEAEQEKETEEEVEKETETAAEPEKETEAETEPEKEPEQVAEPEEKKEEKTEEQQDSTPKTVVPRSTRSNPSANSGTKSTPNYEYTEQPSSGSFDGSTLTYRVTWKTNFTPVKVEIYKSYPVLNDVNMVTITAGLSANGRYDIPVEWDSGDYYVRAYYGSGNIDYITSVEFYVDENALGFITQPKDGSFAGSTLTYRATWSTNYKPVKVEIYRKYYAVFDQLLEDTVTTGLSANGSYHIPVEWDSGDYFIRTYYSSNRNDYHDSQIFSVNENNLKIITQPKSGNFSGTTRAYHVTWSTSYTPIKVVIYKRYEMVFGDVEQVTLTSGLSANGSYDIPVDWGAGDYYIKTYYSSNHFDWHQSEVFTVEKTGFSIISQPQSGSFSPYTLTYHVTWQTGYVPTKVEIYKRDGYIGEYINYKLLDTMKTGLSAKGSYDIPLEWGTGSYHIKIYYSSNYLDNNVSNYFDVDTSDFKFTIEPRDGSFQPYSLTYNAIWQTNFKPTKVEICKSFPSLKEMDTITTGLSSNGNYPIPYTWGSGSYMIKAYYGNIIAYSEEFFVDTSAMKFTVQPQEGFFDSSTHTYHATWRTSFVPTKIMIGQNFGLGDPIIYESGLSANGSYDIPASMGAGEYIIRAYFASGYEDYCQSEKFEVFASQPEPYGTCGKNITWTFENHTLTLSGTGALDDFNYYDRERQPWRYFKSEIRTLVIEEGISCITANAFRNHTELTKVYLPSSMGYISQFAFDNCVKLTDVYCNFPEVSVGNINYEPSLNKYLASAAWHFAYRESGSCGENLYWKLETNNTLVISGSGRMDDYESNADTPWYKYRNDIVEVRIDGGSSIGKNAFSYLNKLAKVTIPYSVTSMGEMAFAFSKSLKTVTISSESINFPTECFRGCTSLESIRIPRETTVIGLSAFSGCTSLAIVTFASGSKLTSIQNFAFSGCKKLTEIYFPNGLLSIGASAFENCQGLTSLTLPTSLITLDEKSFANCNHITGIIKIPSGVASIPKKCFYGCSNFYMLSMGTSVKRIYTGAFDACTSLAYVHFDGFRAQWPSVTVDSNNEALNTATFTYLYIYGKLPNSNTTYSIYGYNGRLTINGGDELNGTNTMPWAAYGQYIEEIDISGSFTVIGPRAFKNCISVKTLYLPGTVKTIGAYAFQDCTSLEDVYFDGVRSDWDSISFGAYNQPLSDATLHCTGTIWGSLDGSDIYWTFDDVDTLTLYFDMDAGKTDMPDFRDDREQPWYEYQNRIKHIYISEGVTKLGDDNFACLTYLEDVHFPSSIERMGSGVFSYCHNLVDVILPDSVESITSSTFWGCGNLNSVKLPANLTRIPVGMFYNCGTLNRVYIPSTVTHIDENAFKNCTDLSDIYFDGTSAQWAQISIASGNEKLNSVNIHFVVPELAINDKNFPDANFRQYVKSKIDKDHSGWLTEAECLAVKSISCPKSSIESLKGIEYFPEITSLDCSGNDLHDELDLRELLKLVEVYCENNPNLDEVYVDGLAELQILDCHNNTNMGSPDVRTNPALRQLNVANCQINTINVSANRALEYLICNDNQLTKLELSNNLKLKYLECYTNKLTTLDLTDHLDLTYINCADNKLEALKLGKLPNCTMLKCQYNELTALDIVACPYLVECVLSEDTVVNDIGLVVDYTLGKYQLYVDKNVKILTEHEGIAIDETNFPDLSFREDVFRYFDTDHDGWLSAEEIENVTEIEVPFEGICDMTGLQYFTYLRTLIVCGNDDLTELDLSGNPDLEYLDCWGTMIEELDLSTNRRLQYLDCNSTLLTRLNVSGLTNLQSIDVSGCSLSELDVSDCRLITLWCHDNPLTNLVLGDQPELYYFWCYGTDLTELDISRCALLVDAWLNVTPSEANGIKRFDMGESHHEMKLDSDIEVIYEHEGIAITEANFPDDNFRAFIAENFDTDKNGWLSEEEISNVTDIQAASMNISSLKGIEYFTYLEILNVNFNELESLNLKKNTALGILECNNNKIQMLDLSANENLFALFAGGMETLVAINVSGLTEMKTIAVHDDSLTKLDLSECPIEFLNCSNNPLTSLILGDQPSLNYLLCYGTELETLDISGCPKLVDAWLNGDREDTEWGMSAKTDDNYMELDPDTEIHYLDFVGANMTLGNELSMSFFVNKDDVEINQGYYIKITKIYEDREDVVVIVPSSEWTLYQNKYYRIRFNGVAAKEMNDRINVQMFDAADNAVSDVWEDSVADYVMRALPKAPDRERRLMVDMLNYGAAAQVYFNYNTENLANGYLTEEWQEYATKNVTTENKRIAGENYYGTVLNLGSRLQMSMYFNNLSTNMYAIVSFTDHYGHEKEVTIEGNMFKEEKANLFRIYIEEMAVADARQMITCKVYNTDGAVVAEAIDSIESYIARATAVSSNPLYEEVMKFADSAYAYFHP